MNMSCAAFSVARMRAICSYRPSSSVAAPVIDRSSSRRGARPAEPEWSSWSAGAVIARSLAGVEMGLRLAHGVELPTGGPVLAAGHEQLLGRELGDDLAAVRGDHQLLLDARGGPAVG